MNIRNSLTAITISLLATGGAYAQAPSSGNSGSTPAAGQRPEAGTTNGSGNAGTSGSMGSSKGDNMGSMQSGKAAKTTKKSTDAAHQGQAAASGGMGSEMQNNSMKPSSKPMTSPGASKTDGMKPSTGTTTPAPKQ